MVQKEYSMVQKGSRIKLALLASTGTKRKHASQLRRASRQKKFTGPLDRSRKDTIKQEDKKHVCKFKYLNRGRYRFRKEFC